MNKIFEEYADKYTFLKELSEQEQAVIICMLYEQKQRIEKNNGWIKIESEADLPKEYGWIKIESEADLPKEYGEYHFRTNYNTMINYSGWYSSSDKKFYDRNNYFDIVEVTHYRPIEKLLPPIY